MAYYPTDEQLEILYIDASLRVFASAKAEAMRARPILHHSVTLPLRPFLFLHQRPVKNGPGVKSCVIGPPQAPAVFILFLEWQVKQ
jgi:hypothetical protein